MRSIRLLLAILLLSCLTVGCHKSTPGAAVEPSPTWSEVQKASTENSQDMRPDIETLLDESRYIFKSPSVYTVERVHRFRILTEQGREDWDFAVAHWSPWYQQRPALSAKVTDPNGKTSVLDPKTIVEKSREESSANIISDARQLVAPLPNLQVGSIVEVVRSQDHIPSVYGAAMIGYHYFGAVGRRVETSTLVIRHPEKMSLKLNQNGLDIEPEVQNEAGVKTLRFTQTNLAPIATPLRNLPVEMAIVPSIKLSTGLSWKSVVETYMAHTQQSQKNTACDAQIKALIGAKDLNRPNRLAALLDNLRAKIRYTGLELGENSIIPVGPCETLKRGFGDCKDQATLLVAALGKMGIKAHLALVKSDYDVDIAPDMPSLMDFNHVIVYIPGKAPVWIDPSLDYARPGELSTSVQGRRALVIAEDTDQLIFTPKIDSSQNRFQEERTIKLSPSGKGSIREISTYDGAFERYERGQAIKDDPEKLRENLATYVKNVYESDQLLEARQNNPNDLKVRFGYHLSAKDIAVAQTDDMEAVAALNPWSLFQYLPDDIDPRDYTEDDLKETRTADFELYTPGQIEIVYNIKAPIGFGAKSLPKKEAFEIGSFKFGVEFAKTNDRNITAKYYLDHGDGKLSPEHYGELRQTFLDWTRDFPRLIRFKNTALHLLEQGKYKEALLALQDTIAKSKNDPKEHYIHQLWYSKALLQTGFGTAAIEAARRATEISPTSIEAWIGLGWALEHNYLAQRFGTGYNRAAAGEAYNKAIAINPEDLTSRMSLAILLEHDLSGRRYLDPTDLNAAIEQYRQILTFEDNLQVKKNLLLAAVLSEKFDDVLKQTEERPKDQFIGTLRLTAILAKAGLESGLSTSSKLFKDENERLGALEQASNYLLRTRRYDLAARTLEASAKGQEGLDKRLRAKSLHKMTKSGTAFNFDKGPVRVLQKLYLKLLDESPDIRALWHPKVASILPEEFETELMSSFLKGRRTDGNDLPTAVMRDLMLSQFEYQIKRNGQNGYRIRASGLGSHSLFTAYVIKQQKQFWLVGLDGGMSAAPLIRDFLKQGNLTRAQKWLDWIAEDKSAGTIFKKFWTPNCQGDKNKANLAALYLLASSKSTAQDTLDRIDPKPSPDGLDGDQVLKRLIQLRAHFALEQYKNVSTLAAEMIEKKQTTDIAWGIMLGAAAKSRDFKTAKKVARAQLKRDPNHTLANETLSNALMREGQLEAFWKRMKDKERKADIGATDYNNMAWMSLFSFGTLEEGLNYSLKSLKSHGRHRAFLHTLATIYAELGKLAESYQLLLKIYKSYDKPEPQNEDWYIIGRLAEHYRLHGVAKDAYCRVEKPEHRDKMSSYHLAQKRLKKMKAKACPKGSRKNK